MQSVNEIWPVYVMSQKKKFLGEPPTSLCHFFCPSVCLSHTISQELYII